MTRFMLLATMLVLPATAAAQDAPFAAKIAKIIDGPDYKTASWGILAVDAKTGETVYALNADRLFSPASTTKLFTCAAALTELGADHRFETKVYQRGERMRDNLAGDLILLASGDLTFGGRTTPDGKCAFKANDHTYANGSELNGELTDTDPLAALKDLAKQVAATGIKEILGEVMVDDRLFERAASSGSGPDFVSPILVNDNIVDVIIAPGAKEGESAVVRLRPDTALIQMDNGVTTADAKSSARITITGDGPNRFRIRGRIPLGGKERNIIHPVDDPKAFARSLFIDCLAKEGVRVNSSKFQQTRGELPRKGDYADLKVVASHKSPLFSEAVKVTMKVSHNLYASTMPLLVGAKHGGTTLAEGMRREGAALKALGLPPTSVSFAGGAGGTRSDYVSPRAAVDLLAAMDKRPEGKVFFDTLPVLGVDGTLATVVPADSPAKGKARAKTGTYFVSDLVNDRMLLTSKALAGDLETKSGRRLFFAMYVNNVPLPKGVLPAREGKVLGKLCEILYDE